MADKNNETVGISSEVAIAKEYNVPIGKDYASRANYDIVDSIRPCVKKVFHKYNIPNPVRHVAEGQNPVDFILSDGKTLSVKSNQEALGKVAPQKIGQPTANTYFQIMGKELSYDVTKQLRAHKLDDNYESRAFLFKEISLTRTKEVLDVYWRYMFDCDYLIHFYNIFSNSGLLLQDPKAVVFGKLDAPDWDETQLCFSQDINSWNESCVLKYKKRSIGEFQAHRHRNCLKFRFNMDKIKELYSENLI